MDHPKAQQTFTVSDVPWVIHRVIRKLAIDILPIRLHLRLAAVLAGLHLMLRGSPPAVERNLLSVFSGDLTLHEIREMSARFAKYSRQLYLYRMLPCHRGFGIPGLWRIEGVPYLDDALSASRGAILVTAHLGFPHLIPPILRLRGYNVQEVIAGINRSERQAQINDQLARSSQLRQYIHERTRVFTEDINSQHIIADLDIRPIYRLLRENGIVMIAGEGFRATKFVLIPLCGQLYPFPMGYMQIAMRFGVPILPAFCILNSRGEITVRLHPPLPVDKGASLEHNVGLFASLLDKQLRETPHLWLRWRIDDWFEVARQRAGRDLKERQYGSGSTEVNPGEGLHLP